MLVNEVVEKLLNTIDYSLSNWDHSTIGRAYLKGEKGALLMVKQFLENGEIPEIIKESGQWKKI